jgi:hypothetical protein
LFFFDEDAAAGDKDVFLVGVPLLLGLLVELAAAANSKLF